MTEEQIKKIKPMPGWIKVRMDSIESPQTKSGFLLTELEEKKSDSGVVEAVGADIVLPNGTTHKIEITIGERVFLKGYAGDSLKAENGTEYRFVLQSDILGIVE
jgi:co-chaperonin GroES (HSP10)